MPTSFNKCALYNRYSWIYIYIYIYIYIFIFFFTTLRCGSYSTLKYPSKNIVVDQIEIFRNIVHRVVCTLILETKISQYANWTTD